MRLLTIFLVVSEPLCKQRNEVRPAMLKSFGWSFVVDIWAFNTSDSKYSYIPLSPVGPLCVQRALKRLLLFCLSVRHYRDYSDLCFGWVPQILTDTQGTVHSWVLHLLFHHGISYDHSGNNVEFEHHCPQSPSGGRFPPMQAAKD